MTSIYIYKARDINGNKIENTIESKDENSAILTLRNKNLFITDIKKANKLNIYLNNIDLFNRITSRDLMIISRQLSTMIKAGITIVDSLDVLAQQNVNNKFKKSISSITERVRTGEGLGESFEHRQDVFPSLFVNMITAGEESGALDDILDKISIHYQKDYDTKEKVKNVMTYPIILLVVSLAVIYILITQILPEFSHILDDAGITLPLITEIIIRTGILIDEQVITFLILLMIFLGAVYLSLKTKLGIRFFELFLLVTPFIKDIYIKVSMARFSRTLATLVGSGIPLLESLKLVKKTLNNGVVESVIDSSILNLKKGQPMSEPMAQSDLFPPLVSKMIAVGEETGQLEEMLIELATFYEKESKFTLERLSSLIEPFMILFMTIIVGLIVLSVVLPMVEIWQIF
ncbi:type II secretion system F family protein [Natranaerobius trueperi]|uniref:Type II secretion system protein GspF domain-containing protein n=1 Tax=Natranaerobius trueperi TaxID=759412 RepID=A0A226BZ41_9FIRM|nr:type II secretion system F family protein [Natranaerobius trueperi]OWZ84052.1 hypothetical protein CDO51_05695 [Natranaerobius trueperi]